MTVTASFTVSMRIVMELLNRLISSHIRVVNMDASITPWGISPGSRRTAVSPGWNFIASINSWNVPERGKEKPGKGRS